MFLWNLEAKKKLSSEHKAKTFLKNFLVIDKRNELQLESNFRLTLNIYCAGTNYSGTEVVTLYFPYLTVTTTLLYRNTILYLGDSDRGLWTTLPYKMR